MNWEKGKGYFLSKRTLILKHFKAFIVHVLIYFIGLTDVLSILICHSFDTIVLCERMQLASLAGPPRSPDLEAPVIQFGGLVYNSRAKQ